MVDPQFAGMLIGCFHELLLDYHIIGNGATIVEIGHGYHEVTKQAAFETNQWQDANDDPVFILGNKIGALMAKGFLNQLAPFSPVVDRGGWFP